MLKPKPASPDALVEPAPRYPTDADIATAERLRHRLEQQYFAALSAASVAAEREDEEEIVTS